ncbi:transporter substrate-binding domain-containing protein [Verrucomicrobiota bacterium]
MKEHPVVRMGFNPDMEPLIIASPNGDHTGILIDLFNKIGDMVDLKIDIELAPWTEMIEKARRNEVDGLAAATPTLAHSLQMPQTDPLFEATLTAIGKDNFIGEISSLKDLEGLTLTHVKGIASIEHMLDQIHDKCAIIEVDNMREAFTLTQSGVADLTISHHLDNYQLKKFVIQDIKPVYRFKESGFKVAPTTRSDWPELLSILNKSLRAIGEVERNNIVEKWLQNTPTKRIKLTPEERDWVQKHPVIKATNEGDWPPFNMIKNGKPTGFCVELLELMAQKIGVKVEFIHRPWSELEQMGKSKQLDVLTDAAETPERLKHFLYTKETFAPPASFFIDPDRNDIHSIEDLLNNKTVAVGKGYSVEDLLRRAYPEMNLVPVLNPEAGVLAVARGTVDAFYGIMPPAQYYIKEAFISNVQPRAIEGVEELEATELSIAVRNDWPELLHLLNKARKNVSRAELDHLYNKWMPGITIPAANTLTAAEKKWLEEHQEIRLGIDPEFSPFEFLEFGQKYSGVVSDFVRIISKNLNVEMNPVVGISWAEVIKRAKSGDIDVIPCIVKTEERSKFLTFTDPYVNKPVVILARHDSPYFEGISDIPGSIAVVDGYFSQELLVRDYPEKNYLVVSSISEAITAISKGKADALVGNLSVITHSLQKLNIQNMKVAGFTEYSFKLRFGVRKDWPELVEIINKQLAAISETEKSQIISSWTNFRVQKEVDWAILAKWVVGVLIISGCIISFFIHTNKKLVREVNERKIIEKRLEKSNQAKSEFLSNMSHEIRTPMNAVLGFTAILKKHEQDPKKKHYIECIHSAGTALLSLINNVLDLSKIEAAKLELSYAAISLENLCQELNSIFGHKIQEKGLEFEIQISDSVPSSLIMDELRIRQILINLIGNALKFTEQGSIKLVIASNTTESHTASQVDLKFEVHDTGVGISPEYQSKIFGSFEQAQKSRDMKGGTGLGLAITKSLIEMMNGKIWLVSQLGQGSTFGFCLHGVEVAAGEIDKGDHLQEQEHIVFEGASVLVVDDMDYNREIIASFLEDRNLSLLFAENGQQALDMAREHLPDLILLDMRMPVMDGYEASQKIKADKRLKAIPVVAVTADALTHDEDRISGICDGYLRKPVGETALLTKLQTILPHHTEAVKEHSESTSEITATEESQPSRDNLQGVHILLVEDNEINQEIAVELLSETGARISVANNGQEALERVQEQAFDLILMDLQMPVMDGLSATRAIRSLNTPDFDALPILAMSAGDWAEDKNKCITAGMNGNLSKPLDSNTLISTLKPYLK